MFRTAGKLSGFLSDGKRNEKLSTLCKFEILSLLKIGPDFCELEEEEKRNFPKTNKVVQNLLHIVLLCLLILATEILKENI